MEVNNLLETILSEMGLRQEKLAALAEHFTEQELVRTAFNVHVDRANGNIEKQYDDEDNIAFKLTPYEQLLHELFKNKVCRDVLFKLDEDKDGASVQILFENNYSRFRAITGKYDGGIALTEEFPDHILEELIVVARKCKLGIIKGVEKQ